jgi:tRNA-(ms[2]io[6]A)-hydroxylase
LNLASDTDPRWTDRVLENLDELLVDHAHCEKKAAGMAVQLIFRYTHHAFLHEPLSRLAREELLHFEQVLGHLGARGTEFRGLKPSPYAGKLRTEVRTFEPEHLVDTLLCCALIEARSCERFKLLADAVTDAGLAAFYQGLLASEARHHQIYLDLAVQLVPAEDVHARLRVLAEHEAAVLRDVPELARMHG